MVLAIAVFLFSISALALLLSFYTVKKHQGRRVETIFEIAAGVFRLSYSAKIFADGDEPEVVDAPAEQERIEPVGRIPATTSTTAIESPRQRRRWWHMR